MTCLVLRSPWKNLTEACFPLAYPSQRLFWFLRVVMGLFMGAVVLSEYQGPGGRKLEDAQDTGDGGAR